MPRPTVLALPMLALAACGSEPAAPAEPISQATLEVLFAGIDKLADTSPHERLLALSEALATSPSDVVCLQGVWSAADRKTLKDVLHPRYPFSLDLPTNEATPVTDPAGASAPASTPPCSEPLAPAIGCAKQVCSTIPADDEASVTSEACLDTYCAVPLQPRCDACWRAGTRSGWTFGELRHRCEEVPGDPLMFGGEHGLLVLSSLPLDTPSLRVLPGAALRRAILGATAHVPAGPDLDVYCTALGPTTPAALPSPPFAEDTYVGLYGAPDVGWSIEHDLQIDQLIDHVGERSAGRPTAVLGNFNASTAVTADGETVLEQAAPGSAARLLEAFGEGVPDGWGPRCTVCPQNPLLPALCTQRGCAKASPTWLNRIYLAGAARGSARSSVRTYLGNVVEVEPVDFGLGVTSSRVPLSLQYGFRTHLELPR